MYKSPEKCCICGNELTVTRLRCKKCKTEITGEFEGCRFCSLPKEQAEFLITFLKCRGSIKSIEKELGISYPTVKNMTDSLLKALNINTESSAESEKPTKSEILRMLEKKEISSEEAMIMIKELQ